MKNSIRRFSFWRSLSCLISVSVFAASTMPFPIFRAAAQIEWKNKLDSELLEFIEQAEANEIVSAAVWFSDISYDDVYAQERTVLAQEISCGTIAPETLYLLDDAEKAFSSNLPLESANLAIHIERSIASEQYIAHNGEAFFEILPHHCETNIYISRYSPCVLAELSADEIIQLAESDEVHSIMICDGAENEEPVYDFTYEIDDDFDENNLDHNRTDLYPRLNKFKEDIGVTAVQQYLNASGIIIGILEGSGKPDVSLSCLQPIYSSGRYHIIPTTASVAGHASAISTVLAGKTADGYEGVAYDATYYYTCDDYYTAYDNPDHRRMAAAEDLIDHDVNIITRSVSVGNRGDAYGVFSRFYDHISTCHHVHFCTAVGNVNNGNHHVINSNMGYNVIVVGSMAYTTNGYVHSSTSCYSTNTDMPYKPDVLAPQGVELPYSDILTGGSSIATPITAGALAYFLKSNGYITWAPAMGKVAVCSGSSIGTTDSIPNSNALEQIAMDRPLGVGMVNIQPAFEAFYNWQTLTSDTFSFGTYLDGSYLNLTKSFVVSASDVIAEKRLNVCFCHNVRNTYAAGVSHNTNPPAIGSVYPLIMTVTAPNGTVYTANYSHTNMEVVSFIPTVSGTYTVNVHFANTSDTFDGDTRFGFMANLV